MALQNGTFTSGAETGRHEFIFTYEEISQTQNSNGVFISTVRWSVDLESYDSYGAIESTTSKKWTLKINGKQIASGNNRINMDANSTINLASGTFSWERTYPNITEYLSAQFTQNFGITFNGRKINDDWISGDIKLGAINKGAEFAYPLPTGFTDVSNPSFNFTPGAGVSSLEFWISSDIYGNTLISDYVEITNTSSGYFEYVMPNTLREEIRNVWLKDASSKRVYYQLKSTFSDGSVYKTNTAVTMSLADVTVTLVTEVFDNNPATVAATGSNQVLVKYASNAEFLFEYEYTPSGSDIVTAYVQNGNVKMAPTSGVFEGVESGEFNFYVEDSRGVIGNKTITLPVIDYVKPTCYGVATTELSGNSDLATGATVKLIISGSYFDGNFGAKDNELKLEVKHTQNDGSMGDWVELTSGLIPVFDGNKYTLETTISGFTYERAYTFVCRASDLVSSVESPEFTIRVLPIFDWSNVDFNFNVPVNMSKNTVLRYNAEAHNTVVSGGEDGKVYLRPGGTDVTDGEVVIHSTGKVDVSGNLDVSGDILVNGISLAPPADYIIETGTEAMGTNGTWYWEKWLSGKAVCWGTRNFGSMSIGVSTSTGFYRSAAHSQNFPSGLFTAAPDSVQMTLVGSGVETYSAYISPFGSSSVTSSSTEEFVLVNHVGGSLPRTNISFHITGRWK